MKTLILSGLLILVMQVQGQTKKTKLPSNTKFLVGTWNLIQAPNNDGMSISQTWEFNGTDFKMYGYPQIQQQGRYTIVKDKGDSLILNLYGQKGDWGPENKKLKLLINRKTGMMTMNSMEFKKK